MGECHQSIYNARQIGIERWYEDMQVGQRQQNSIIFKCVMRAAHHAISISAAVSDKYDRKIRSGYVIADLFEWPRVHKWRDTVYPRPQTGFRQSGRHADHVLT